jgi:hypothetical protein
MTDIDERSSVITLPQTPDGIWVSPKCSISFIVKDVVLPNAYQNLLDFQNIHSPTIMMPDLEVVRLGIETLVVRTEKDLDCMTKGLKDVFLIDFDIRRGRGFINVFLDSGFEPAELKQLIIDVMKKGEDNVLHDPLHGVTHIVAYSQSLSL